MSLSITSQFTQENRETNAVFWEIALFKSRECVVCFENRRKFVFHPIITSKNVVSDQVMHLICMKCIEEIFTHLGEKHFDCPHCHGVFPLKDKRLKWMMPPGHWESLSSEDLCWTLDFLFHKKEIVKLRSFLNSLEESIVKIVLKHPDVQKKINCITELSGSFGYLSVLKVLFLSSYFIISQESQGNCLKNASRNGHESCVRFLCKFSYIRLRYLKSASNCAKTEKIEACIRAKIRKIGNFYFR